MRKRSVFFLILTLIVLSGTIYLPLGISNFQDEKLLSAVHAEQLSDNPALLQETLSTTDKLSILTAGQEFARTTVDFSKEEEISQRFVEEIEKMVKKGILYEAETFAPEKLQDLVMSIYEKGQDKMRVYSFTAFNDFYNMDVKMDAESSKIYEFTIYYDLSQSVTVPLEGLSSAWAEYLDVAFQDVDEVQGEGEWVKVKGTEVYYNIIRNKDFVMAVIQSESQSAAAETGDGDMMAF